MLGKKGGEEMSSNVNTAEAQGVSLKMHKIQLKKKCKSRPFGNIAFLHSKLHSQFASTEAKDKTVF